MDNNQLQYIKIQSQYADEVEQFEKCVVKAAKLTHAIADTAEKKCKQARMAMESGNIDVMRNTIQQYICQYGRDWSRFRDVRIQLVDGNTYAQLSAVDLIQQLHCVITLVYKDTALKTVNKERNFFISWIITQILKLHYKLIFFPREGNALFYI